VRIAVGMMVKDEADVIAQNIDHLLGQGVDRIFVLDNGSTDGTRDLLNDAIRNGAPVTVTDDPERGYYQSAKMTQLQHDASKAGYQWFVPVDADELWSGESEFDTLRDVLDSMPENVTGVKAALYDHFATGKDDLGEPDPFRRMVWRVPEAQSLPKVCVRCDVRIVIEQGNHGAYIEEGGLVTWLTMGEGLRIDHYPYRSVEQFISKARNGAEAYRLAPGLPEDMGVHWRQYGKILDEQGEAGMRSWFREHFYYPETWKLVRDLRYARA
jgi:glycosyltransferase involved in cell wall biosynthesis